MTDSLYARLRIVHLLASGLLALIALTHAGLTWRFYQTWSTDAVWFLGTGLGLLLLALLNLSHIGVEACRQPTTRLVRAANWAFALFGLAAILAVPELQAYAVALALGTQAVVCRWTLPGPA